MSIDLEGVYVCRECQSPLIATKSGSLCSNGHGRLQGPLPKDVARRNHYLVMGVPEAQMGPRGYYVNGEGPFHLKKKITRLMDRMPRDGFVYALEGNAILQLSTQRG